MSNEQRFTARALLANQQGGRVLEQMSVSPQQPLQCRTILGVVVHATTVFFNKQAVGVLLPFVNILNNPAALNVSWYKQVRTLMISLCDIHTAFVPPYNARRPTDGNTGSNEGWRPNWKVLW